MERFTDGLPYFVPGAICPAPTEPGKGGGEREGRGGGGEGRVLYDRGVGMEEVAQVKANKED